MAHTLGVMKNRIAQRPEEFEPELRLENESKILKWAIAPSPQPPPKKPTPVAAASGYEQDRSDTARR